MKHAITPQHLALVELYKEALATAECKLDVTYYAGFDTTLEGDMNAISCIHYYNSYTGVDGLAEFQQLEDARQLISKDTDFVRINVLSLPQTHRTDIDLQVTKIS